MPLREDDVAPRSTGVPGRWILLQAGGFALAIAATLAVFLTDDAQVLRVAVVGVAWAFVLATVAAGRRTADRVAARARETQLRRSYESELEREVAARREYELELEARVRREAEESMRGQLDALRADLSGLPDLRAEVARVAELRTDLTALSSLRDEVARVASLRDDVTALGSLRQELGQLAELRADMGRLRAELSEQLSSEMLIERIVMRTQASRLPGEPAARTLDGAGGWSDDVPPRELTGGRPAVRLDESRQPRQFEQVRVERPAEIPATATWETLSAPSRERPSWESARTEDPPPTAAFPMAPPSADPSAGDPPPTTMTPTVPPPVASAPPSPLEWLAARALIDAEPTSFRPEVPPRRRRGDEVPTDSAAASTSQRPAVPANPPIRIDDRGGYRVAVRDDQPAERPAPPAPEKRLADILAENGVSPATGGRRRRRYRDEDEPDDVLARVLGTT
jgi:hypothetical protein